AAGAVAERGDAPGAFVLAVDGPVAEGVEVFQHAAVAAVEMPLAVEDAGIGAGPEAEVAVVVGFGVFGERPVHGVLHAPFVLFLTGGEQGEGGKGGADDVAGPGTIVALG